MEQEYRYLCTERPPQVGAMPKAGLRYVEAFRNQKYAAAVKRLIWGYAVYNRPLTDEEMSGHGVIYIPEG